MASISNIRKKRGRGRPAVGATPIMVRMPPIELGELDGWIKRQSEKQSRPEAIRRLVELGLAGSSPAKRPNPKAAAKASDMAAHQIDKLANLAMPEEERRARKRRLIKGPREFRDMRGDQPKPKG
jgi:hypothetical protein